MVQKFHYNVKSNHKIPFYEINFNAECRLHLTVGLKWNFVHVVLNLRLRVLAFANAWARICSVEFAFARARICECVSAHLQIAANLRAKFALNLRAADSTQMRWINLIGWHIHMRDGRWLTKNLLDYINRVCLFMNTYDYWIIEMHGLVLIVFVFFVVVDFSSCCICTAALLISIGKRVKSRGQ